MTEKRLLDWADPGTRLKIGISLFRNKGVVLAQSGQVWGQGVGTGFHATGLTAERSHPCISKWAVSGPSRRECTQISAFEQGESANRRDGLHTGGFGRNAV